ncbi:PH domain-containing protein [Mucisphaera sp.]|uniref:PH domain-containing protein n=1 Tax=Mucisphaera sp. TaxID=2913024 RepID=UPI003D0C11A2
MHTPAPHKPAKPRLSRPHHAETASSAEDIDPRFAAMIPAELLQAGEIIILFLKPSLWFILLNRLSTLAAILAITTAAYLTNQQFNNPIRPRDLLLLAIATIGMTLFWAFFEWLSRVYILTDQRIITLSGVIRVYVFQTRLEKIQHTRLIFSLRERLFALGTLTFATSGSAFEETAWPMVSQPLEVHQQVLHTLNRYRH